MQALLQVISSKDRRANMSNMDNNPQYLLDGRDPLFKGCTRPAMFLGVPVTPLVVVTLPIILVSVWINILISLLIVPAIAVMHLIAREDDQQFRLLWLQCQFRCKYFFGNGRFWGASAYSPMAFKKMRRAGRVTNI